MKKNQTRFAIAALVVLGLLFSAACQTDTTNESTIATDVVTTLEPEKEDTPENTPTKIETEPVETEPAESEFLGFITFISGGDIFIMTPDGSNPKNITNTPDIFETSPKISYDGERIVFQTLKDAKIHVMNILGGNRHQVTSGTSEDKMPAWSPDGRIVYVATTDTNEVLYIMDADGSNVEKLLEVPTPKEWIYDPAFSPDGSKIVFSYTFDIYIMDADGTNLTQITTDGAFNVSPSWSPDGKKIVFHNRREFGNIEIYVMDIDGSNDINITNNPEYDQQPSWSPNGQRIVFASTRDGNLNLYTMDPDGSNIEQLTFDYGAEPFWQPVVAP